MNTRKFKLLSGVDCEIAKFTGKHQRYFTEEQYQKDGVGANMVLADIIVKLGDLNSITKEEAGKLLSEDRKMILMQARDFSLKRHKTFKFEYKYEKDDKMIVEPMELDFNLEDFPAKKYKRQFNTYQEVWDALKGRNYASVKLEDLGEKVFFTIPTGEDENKVNKISKKTRSSHSLLEMKRPCRMVKSSDDKGAEAVPINLNLDNLSLDDLADLREAIQAEVGYQDTKAIFTNPETEKDEEIELMTLTAFYFPSNAL